MTDTTLPSGAQSELRPAQGNIHAATLLPPAQPVYVLRGHSVSVHALAFLRHNLRLLTGDADGWVSLWSLASKRAVAVWRAHHATVLALKEWDDEKIVSQGRDGRLIVWQLRPHDEPVLEKNLPVNGASDEQKQPWMLHSLLVNTLNFCAFSACCSLNNSAPQATPNSGESNGRGLLVAVPAVRDGQVDVFQLPNEHRISTIPSVKNAKTGMVMALQIFYLEDMLRMVVGYESGCVAFFTQSGIHGDWVMDYHATIHSQPVLSVDIAPSLGLFYSSSADAVIAQHPLYAPDEAQRTRLRKVATKHSGQQALTVRSDEKIFATAGWDSRIRVYSAKTLRELGVLKWHKQGCYAISFADLHKPRNIQFGDDEKVNNGQAQTLDERREARTEHTHWLAVGAKDGKVSLWDIY